MSSPGSSPTPRADRVRLEQLALGLALHGFGPDTPALVKALARSPLALEARLLLRAYGLAEYEINLLMGTHPQGCACWRCVQRLRNEVLRHRRKLTARAAAGTPRPPAR